MIGRKWLGVAVVAGVIAAGGGVTLAASASPQGPTHGRKAPFGPSFWSAVAAKAGVPASTLEQAVQSVLRSEKANAKVHTRMGHLVGGPWGRMAFGPRPSIVRAAAAYLGLSVTSLRSDLRSGETLEAITQHLAATGEHVSVTGLENALLSREESNLQARVDAFVTSGFPPGHGRARGSRATTSPA